MKRYILILVPAILLASSNVHNVESTIFDLMQIEQVIGGVNGDATAQAIQLRMRAAGQNATSGTRLIVRDAAGANPVIIVTLGNVLNGAVGDNILIVSPNFPAETTPAAVGDFTMANLIPSSYLAAGSLTFQSGATVLWRLSWGYGGYSGPTTGSIINDFDGEFGPSFGSAMPSAGEDAVKFLGAATDLSTSNVADYSLTGSGPTFRNNLGNSFTVGVTTGIEPTVIATRLLQNHPNPFTPSTEIEFIMPQAGRASVEVFDIQGRLVTTLFNGTADIASNIVEWDGTDDDGNRLGSGIYFYRLTTVAGVETRKMVLLR